MSLQGRLESGPVVQLRLRALEKRWGMPHDEILALALQACQGVHSDLGGILKAWMSPNRQALLQEGERLFGGGWTLRRATDD